MRSQHLNQNGRYAILHATYRNIIINTKTLTARTAQKKHANQYQPKKPRVQH